MLESKKAFELCLVHASAPDTVILQELGGREGAGFGGWTALNAFAAAATASCPLKIPAASMTAGQIKSGPPITARGSLKIVMEGGPSSAMDHSAQQIP